MAFQGLGGLGIGTAAELQAAESDPLLVAEYRKQQNRQRIADLLIQQGIQPTQGQMVGRFYVKPDIAQDFSKLGQVAAGSYGTYLNNTEATDKATERAGQYATAIDTAKKNLAPSMQPGPAVETSPSNLNEITADANAGLAPPSLPMRRMPQPSAPLNDPQQAPLDSPSYQPPTMGPGPDVLTQPDPATVQRTIADLLTSRDPAAQRYGTMQSNQQFQRAEHEATRTQQLKMKQMQDELLKNLTQVKGDQSFARTDMGKVQKIDELLTDMDRESPEYQTLTDLKKKLLTPPGSGGDTTLMTDTGIYKRPKGSDQATPVMGPNGKQLNPVEPRPAITVMVGPNGEPVANAVGRGGKMTPLPGTSFHGSTADSNIKLRTVNEKEFTDGPSGKTLNAINTAQGHIALWLKAQDALRNEGIQGFNRVSAFIGKQLGVAAPTDLAGVASVLAPEIMKSTVPGAGGEMERIAIEKQLGVALSPEQATGLADQFHGLMVGKAKTLQQQYMSGQGATDENWQKRLNPDIKRRIAEADAAASKTNQSSRPTVILKFNARGEQLP